MSRTIDDKVVSMEFDNSQFERSVHTSMGTIEKLKSSLKFEGISKGFEGITESAKRVSFSGLEFAATRAGFHISDVFEKVSRFLENDIARRIVNVGTKIAREFTIEPIMTGFQEYELKMGSVQTIMASTGESLASVNKYLEELNEYSDRTIYSFSDMTNNIGKFTNAGVKLEDAVLAIKGISNEAAVSGANAQEASRAMYNFSQALSAGYVKLIDWKSIENANMATVEFKQTLIDTAVEMGTLKKKKDGVYATNKRDISATMNFNDSLQDQWMTTEVLTKTLAKYADETTDIGKKAYAAATEVKTFSMMMDTLKEAAQSGWAYTWELVAGDFEEAKALWTELSETFGGFIDRSADARNALVAGAVESNWEKMLHVVNEAGISSKDFTDALLNSTNDRKAAIEKIIEEEGSLEKAFASGKISLDYFSKTFTTLSGGMTPALNAKIQKLGDSINDLSDKELKSMFFTQDQIKLINELRDKSKETGKSVSELSDDMNNLYLMGLKNSDVFKENISNLAVPSGRELMVDTIRKGLEAIVKVCSVVKQAWSEVFPPITSDNIYNIIKAIHDFTESLIMSDETAEKVKDVFKGLFSVVSIGVDFFSSLAKGALELVNRYSSLKDTVLDNLSAFGRWLVNLKDTVKETDIFGTAVDKLVTIITAAISKIKEFYEYVSSKFHMPKIDGFTSSFQWLLTIVQTIWEFIKPIGEAIGILAKRLVASLSGIFSGEGGINAVTDLMSTLIAGKGMMALVDILANAVDKAGGLKEVLADGLSDVFDEIRDSLEAWQNSIKAEMILKIAEAIAILVASLFVLSLINEDKLKSAIASITGLFIELSTSLKYISGVDTGKLGNSVSTVNTLIGMSAAILILSFALKELSEIDSAGLVNGLIGIFALMEMLTRSIQNMSNQTEVLMKGASQLIFIAIALKIMTSACKDLSELSWEGLIKGLIGIGAMLGALVHFIDDIGNGDKKIMKGAFQLVILGAALEIMADVCSKLSTLSWTDMIKGLVGIGAMLGQMATFLDDVKFSNRSIGTAVSIVILSSALEIMADVCSKFGAMDWTTIGKGIVSVGSILMIFAAFTKMTANAGSVLATAIALVVVSKAMDNMYGVLTNMGQLGWGVIAKGLITLGGSLLILGVALNAMKGTLGGSLALFVATASLTLLVPALERLGNMGLPTLLKSLYGLAASLVILGVAGMLLKPVAGTMLVVAAAMAVFSLSTIALGVGLTTIAIGLSALAGVLAVSAASIVASLEIIIVGFINLIPAIVGAIEKNVEYLAELGYILIQTFLESLTRSIPGIVKALFEIFIQTIDTFTTFIPMLADSLVSFIISIIEVITDKIPEITKVIVNLFKALFDSVIKELQTIDGDSLLEGIAVVGAVTALIYALAGAALIAPLALVGIAAIAGVVSAFGVVLTAISAISGIDGIEEFATKGINLLDILVSGLAKIVGHLVGYLVGGVAEGLAATLPNVAMNLSLFMMGLKPFIIGARMIDQQAVSGMENLISMVLALCGATIIDAITNWITGGNAMTSFGEELVEFGRNIVIFSNIVSGNIDEDAVTAAANAGRMLSEMSETLPNSGGVISWFTGNNDLDDFGRMLVPFGNAIVNFSETVSGRVDEGAVTAAANAGSIMVEMANKIPNSGGILSWFAGNNDVDKFGTKLESFAKSIVSFSQKVSGKIDEGAVKAAANAGDMMVKMAETIPNSGGVVSWFTGDNDIAKFGESLDSFGTSIASFSEKVTGKIDEGAVTAAANAGDLMIAMANTIPNSGGIVTWFTGDNDIETFGTKLEYFGESMTAFSQTISGKIDEGAITAASNAGKALAEMANTIPDTGGIVSWFVGDNDMATFGSHLYSFGNAMALFSGAVSGNIDPDAVEAAANAGKMLAEMSNSMPTEGGVFSWFTGGDVDFTTMSTQLVPFGEAMSEFSKIVAGNIDEGAIESAANAGKILAGMQEAMPEEGGWDELFTGSTDMVKFGEDLKVFGQAMVDFSAIVSGNINAAAITAASNAGKTLAEMEATMPTEGGLEKIVTGVPNISKFSEDMLTFANTMVSFSSVVSGNIDEGAISAATNAGLALAGLENTIPTTTGIVSWFSATPDMEQFSSDITGFGTAIASFSSSITGITMSDAEVSSVVNAGSAMAGLAAQVQGLDTSWLSSNSNILSTFGNEMVSYAESINTFGWYTANIDTDNMNKVNAEVGNLITLFGQMSQTDLFGADSFMVALDSLGQVTLDGFVTALEGSEDQVYGAISSFSETIASAIDDSDASIRESCVTVADNCLLEINAKKPDFGTAGNDLIYKVSNGMTEKTTAAVTAIQTIVGKVVKEVTSDTAMLDIWNAGKNLVQGFANGINDNLSIVIDAATAMARTAYNAAVDELEIHSPSRLFTRLAAFVPAGMAKGIADNTNLVESAAKSMADATYNIVGTSMSSFMDDIRTSARSSITSIQNMIAEGDYTTSYVSNIESASQKLTKAIADTLDTGLGDAIEYSPTIKPVLDLTNVTRESSRISGLLASRSMDMSNSVNLQNGDSTGVNGANGVTFVQNNYSPKALSRYEIYRQTNNQISMMKGMVAL